MQLLIRGIVHPKITILYHITPKLRDFLSFAKKQTKTKQRVMLLAQNEWGLSKQASNEGSVKVVHKVLFVIQYHCVRNRTKCKSSYFDLDI